MTKFRPCIDLHQGKVKQIVGGTLRDDGVGLRENFVSERSAREFAELYREDTLVGGHVIQLGGGNRAAAREALAAWPGGLQVGGGIQQENASEWLEAGASHVIVTSWLFDEQGHFDEGKLDALVQEVGKDRIVLDLSCRRSESGWIVAMNRWQTLTDLEVTSNVLEMLASSCAEYLIHAADVEGLCNGVDVDLIQHLAQWGGIPMTYAGGVGSMEDVSTVEKASEGKLDLTVGSALDLFGGSGVSYATLKDWNRI